MEELRQQDGKTRKKFVLGFTSIDKEVVVNVTNITTIVDALGKAPADWIGAEVGLLTEPTTMAGKPMRGLRLRVIDKPLGGKPGDAARHPHRSQHLRRHRLPRKQRPGRTSRVIPARTRSTLVRLPNEAVRAVPSFSRRSPSPIEGDSVADDLDEFEELPECEPAWQRLDRATAVRKRLLAAGYLPLPVNGKAPPIKGWSDIEATNTIIDRWAHEYADATNTGIITRTTPAIDIDVLDPAVADELQQLAERMIGTSAVRTGRAPKRALMFRTDKPFKKISTPVFVSPDGRTHQVEIMGWGQQIVVNGIHPDTHAPYTWRGAEPGPDLKSDALPLLSAEKASEFISAATQ